MNLAGSKWVTGRNKRQGGGEGAFSRMRRLRGRMTTALLISLFFHLSMITVFRIVVVLPRERVKFYDVRIVSTSDESETPTAATVETPMTRDALALGGASLYDDLPEVELPVIEFADGTSHRYGATEPVSGGGRPSKCSNRQLGFGELQRWKTFAWRRRGRKACNDGTGADVFAASSCGGI